MRYLVTGAAGFIGSQLLRALLEQGHDATGWDAYTEYYDPALKEENARDLPVSRLDLAADTLELDGFDGVFHLAGQPGVASFGGVFPVYVRQNVLASQRLRSGRSRQRARRLRVVIVDLRRRRAYPTPEDTIPRPLRRTGSRSSPASTSRGHTVGVRARCRDRPLLHDLRSAATTGHGLHEDGLLPGRGARLRALRGRLAVPQLHLRR